MNLPESINVAGINYKVEQVKNLANDYELGGQVIYSQGLIKIENDLCQDKKEQVLTHELLHAVFVEAGYNEHEEEMVDRLSKILYQVLKDNKLYFGEEGA